MGVGTWQAKMEDTVTDTRFHQDACGHGPEAYLGSYESGGRSWDAYAFTDDVMGTEICGRFGSDGPDYVSMGPVSFLRGRRDNAGLHGLLEHYAIALVLYEARESDVRSCRDRHAGTEEGE